MAGRPDESVKSPTKAALLRNKLAPDYPAAECWPAPVSDSMNEMNQGAPGPDSALPSPMAMPVDNNRVPPRSGNAGPM